MPDTYDGFHLLAMLRQATAQLEQHAAAVDALNVFPVPDGDTGTNMLLTMRAALASAEEGDASAAAVARAAADGALRGARGNSGVILSQALRGLARGLEGRDSFTPPDFAGALCSASEDAYRGVGQPVEGTILTVLRESAEAAVSAAGSSNQPLNQVLAAAVDRARLSLAQTPDLLPVLKEAGVVDAGGQGWVLLLEGALASAEGRPLPAPAATLGSIHREWLAQAAAVHREDDGGTWGYCTQFLVRGQSLNVDALLDQLSSLGGSVLVVGDASALRVHVHAQDPGPPLSLGASLGTLHDVKVDNMAEQHTGLLARTADGAPAQLPVVAVAPGPGLAEVFRSLGAAIVPGGQTMNPSAVELAEAAGRLAAQEVVLLPNNSNIVATARLACQITSKRLFVVPSTTVPQGLAALLAFNPSADAAANAASMEAQLQRVSTIEVTRATRAATVGGVSVGQGEYIALLEGELVAAADSPGAALERALDRLAEAPGALITLYYGEGVGRDMAEDLAIRLRGRPSEPEVEVVEGGQPHYVYIVSVE